MKLTIIALLGSAAVVYWQVRAYQKREHYGAPTLIEQKRASWSSATDDAEQRLRDRFDGLAVTR